MKLRTQLLTSYLILILLPLIIVGILFYRTGLQVVTKQAQDNVYEIVKKNNEVLDGKLKQIENDSVTLFADKELLDIFNRLDTSKQEELLMADRKISLILGRHFAQNEDLYTYQIWTTYYTFGPQRNMPQGDPTRTKIYREAKQAGGRMVWYPTYDFVEMFEQPWLSDAENYDYRYLFTATRLLNFSHLDNTSMKNLDPEVERPVLAISLKADLFRTLFERSIPENSEYMVMTPDGNIVAHSDAEQVTARFAEDWARPLLASGTGTQRITLNGQNMIVCFDRSEITGWLSVVVIPEAVLVREIVPTILLSTLTLAIVLGAVAITLAFFVVGRITGPIKKVLVAMRFVGEGDFHMQIEPEANDELGVLIRKFNNMNSRIQKLVTENYEIKLKEQQAEIQALNLQMNPHFLYNTLNIMNWVAIENGQKELSRMLVCLSSMLHYTTRKDWDAVELSGEIEWMKNYFYIMSVRFEGKFEVMYDIDPELYRFKVPKLLFQPFVENALIHGFNQLEEGGRITIVGSLENGSRLFRITDNGCGIEEEELARIAAGETATVGIKTMISRIRLRHGEQYGLSIASSPGIGTTVTIHLPGIVED